MTTMASNNSIYLCKKRVYNATGNIKFKQFVNTKESGKKKGGIFLSLLQSYIKTIFSIAKVLHLFKSQLKNPLPKMTANSSFPYSHTLESSLQTCSSSAKNHLSVTTRNFSRPHESIWEVGGGEQLSHLNFFTPIIFHPNKFS